MGSNYSGGSRGRTERWSEKPKSKLEIADDLLRKRQSNLRNWWSDESQARSRNQRREDQLAKAAHERAMELQMLKEAGNTARTGMRQSGALATANRQQLGATKRQGMSETGAITRTGMTTGLGRDRLGLDRSKALFERFQFMKSIGEPQYNEETGIMSPGQSFGDTNQQWNTFKGDSKIFVDDDRYAAINGNGGARGGGTLDRQDSVTTYGHGGRENKMFFDSRGDRVEQKHETPTHSTADKWTPKKEQDRLNRGMRAISSSDDNRMPKKPKKKPIYGDQWSKFKNFMSTPSQSSGSASPYNNRPWRQ